MNFQEFVETARCYNCGEKLDREKPIERLDVVAYKCQCVYSFKIPYDDNGSYSIHLPICEPFNTPEGTFQIPFITISADTGRETFEVKYHSKELSLSDNSKYFRCNYIPNFMSLPKDELITKLNELLVFI